MIYPLSKLVKIKYGKNQKDVLDENGKYPIYGTGGLMAYSNKYLYDKPSVLIGRKGSINKVKYIDVPFWTVDTLFYTEVNEEIVIPKYLYYKMLNMNMDEYNEGTTIPSLRTETLYRIELDIPDKETQKRVIKILESVDKKIELNNKINSNLHELCNNMYFELLSQLDESSSSIKQIKEVSKCVLGGTPSRVKSEYWNGNINWINSGEVNKFRIIEASETITDLGLQKSSTTLLPRGTTVLAITGATLGQVSRLEIDSCANQSVIGIIPNNIELNNYIYLTILNTINDLILKQTGGAQQHINKNDVETHEIIIPNDELIKEFDERIRPIFNKISLTCFENRELEQLRDTLLPELMNGKIDLDNNHSI